MIILFDVDGVLVENRAYRAAIRHTVDYFCRRLSLNAPPPTDADIDVFESQSITVEWDTAAICTLAVTLPWLHSLADRQLASLGVPAADFWHLLAQLPSAGQPALPVPDYAALARRIGAHGQATGQLPARAALGMWCAEGDGAGGAPSDLVRAWLQHFLADIYAIDRSPAMQVFQNFVLGHAHYAQYYRLPPHFNSEPLLEKLDRPLLSAELSRQLLDRRAAGQAYLALYTARPSLAPVEDTGYHRGLVPESEIARSQVGLEGVPVMGLGKLEWFGRRVGRAASDLVKPSPVQALAAMAAARTGQEAEALKAAVAVERGDHLRYPLTACAGETVHVLEDSPRGLQAVSSAVALLNAQGLRLQLVRHGIAPAGSPKQATLAAVSDHVHEDVNAAVRWIWAHEARR